MARGSALSSLLQFRAFRGLDTDALVEELEELAAPLESGVAFRALTRAYLSFASGDLAATVRDALQFSELWSQGDVEGRRLATRAAIWQRDVETARTCLAGLERLAQHGRAVHVTSLTFNAGIAALEGHANEAITQYREALRGWDELELPWDQALAGIDMATTLGPDEPAVVAAAATARSILERLEAKAILARLDGAMRPISDGNKNGVAGRMVLRT
jgi:hypothetical protein